MQKAALVARAIKMMQISSQEHHAQGAASSVDATEGTKPGEAAAQ